ncbi:MAG TPA: fibronectin type III domain-containing protein, partial [Thermoplasmata archaeon]|nr:fibronectin type III domain-containing protein [Thermoplasmata archaeon]
SDLVDASTGALLATFHAPGPVEYLATDSGNGAITVVSSTGETLIANLVPLPGAAGGLAVTATNATLAATWTAATGASGYPVTGYLVYTGASSTGPWTQVGSATTTLTATLTGLTDGTTYFVTVRATSGSGTGPAATAASGTPSGIPYPPTSVAISSSTGSTLVVGWGAPSSTGGLAISAYSVLYATSASGPWTTASAGTQTTATLTGLASGTTYFVKVEAANSAGTSNPSAAVQGKTSGSAPGTSSGGGLSGGSWLWIAIAIVVVVAVVAIALAMMMRRRNTGPTSTGAPPSGPTGPNTPPPGASGGSPPMPPPGAQ